MNISIRKFLLINLLLAITVMTTITIIGNYYLNKKDIQAHLDTLMAISSLSYQALLGDDLDTLDLKQLQKSINNIHNVLGKYQKKNILTKSQIGYVGQFKFQVWSDSGALLLHSRSAPLIPLSSGKEGFSDEIIGGELWRVFTTYNPRAGTNTIIGERYDTRDTLGHIIARDDIYIMLLTFPLSGLLIWFIIGRGLSGLNRIAQEVSSRAPNYLEPVEQHGVSLEIKPVIDELNKLFVRVQDAFEREKRFAADAAHELRTPLAALKTQAQVALKTLHPEEREATLKHVIAGVDRSSHIVQQLLILSRLTPDEAHAEEASEVELVKLSAETIAQLVPSAIGKQIEVELLNTEDAIYILGNATALSILLRNLVDNAIRYTPKGGLVQVALEGDKKSVTLRVTDNGPGIPAELRSRVLERFFRVLGTQSSGSGLGLAIVQQIARLHHAEVKLGMPAVGTGLEVEVIFPRKSSKHRSM